MNRAPMTTEDGSHTLYVPSLNEHYHSVHGAIQESRHIYIREGLEYLGRPAVSVLEAGFGTGLNAYLSLLYAEEHSCRITYHTVEKYPLKPEETEQLNYKTVIPSGNPELFDRLHHCPWEKETALTPYFTFCKHHGDFREIQFPPRFDVVFFDAFNPDVQPHLWTEETLRPFRDALVPGGIFVTYCVKGAVKQALRNLNFTLEKLPGPPGKREILRGTRN